MSTTTDYAAAEVAIDWDRGALAARLADAHTALSAALSAVADVAAHPADVPGGMSHQERGDLTAAIERLRAQVAAVQTVADSYGEQPR